MIDARSVSVDDIVRISEDAAVSDEYKGCYCIVSEIDDNNYNIIRIEAPTTRSIHNYGKDCLLTHYDGTETFKTWLWCGYFDPDVCSFAVFSGSSELDDLFGEMGGLQ